MDKEKTIEPLGEERWAEIIASAPAASRFIYERLAFLELSLETILDSIDQASREAEALFAKIRREMTGEELN